MRDIKFRAWHKTQGWIEDFRLQADGTFCDEMDWDGAYYETHPRRRKNIVLMQYTGLKDKNGKEIYEGDIVNWSSWNKGSIESQTYKKTHQVYWDKKLGSWKIGIPEAKEHDSLEIGIYDDIEVIGNIYENPELINQPEL